MMWVFVVVAVVLVAAIAFVAIGREAFTLSRQPRQATFDFEEAVEWIASHLPDAVTAKLSYDDVRELVRFHLEHLRAQGVPRTRDRALGNGVVIVADDAAETAVLARAQAADLDVDSYDVAEVLKAELAYLAAIGAIGPQIPRLPDSE